MDKIKVLVVDDTIVYRKIVADVLKAIPGVEVVGSATNGKTALSRIASLKPDVVTLDIEMPEMSGIEVLEHLRDQSSQVVTIMLSTLTQRGSEMTIKALELGAFDFISKPDEGTMAQNMAKVNDALLPIINAFKRQKQFRGKFTQRVQTKPESTKIIKTRQLKVQPSKRLAVRSSQSSIVGIGISTGGPKALAKMMPMLTNKLNVPILVVQHMPPVFTKSLAKSLNSKCQLEVKEAENGEALRANTVFIAPGGKQMKIVAGDDGKTRNIKITDDPPENSCKPSVDYLFRSIAEHYIGRSTGVIMTGMGSDGTKGLIQMKNNGSIVIAQDKETCTVYGMPREPIESGIADIVTSLEQIAKEITKTIIR